MARLTDTQLIILCGASQRDDRAVELPATVNGEAARKAVDKLIRAGLLEEVRAASSLPVWRRDDGSGPMALRITKQGLEAIAVEAETVAAPKEASVRPAPARGELEPPAAKAVASGNRISVAAQKSARKKHRPSKAKTKAGLLHESRPTSKQARVLAMLGRPEGATITAIIRVTIGSNTQCVASSPGWCASGSALICARRKSTVTASIASSTAAVQVPVPVARAVAQLERDDTRGDRSGGAGSSVARQRDRASARSRRRGTASPMAHGIQAASTPSPAPPPAVSDSGLSAASRSARRLGGRHSASA